MKKLVVVFLCVAANARAHHIYVANDDHTDYGWNDTTTAYDAAMLGEVDYYLSQIAATQNNSPEEQMRWVADCWWYLYLYEKNRTPTQFQALVDRMKSGHVTVPLNPFVDLYGGFQTEAAIRAGYYPGRLQRKLGVPFLTAQEMENSTIPWGISGLWAASGVKYSWKGICACVEQAPFNDRSIEVFRWQAPDNRELLMKWYKISAGNTSWGGYGEARDNLSQAALQGAIDRFSARAPMVPLTGLFGLGWDDVSYQNNSLVKLAQDWNTAHASDKMSVSNEVDYFTELEAHRASLPLVRGGWGNEWDLQPSTLAARTAQIRRAVEKLRTVEGLWAIVHANDAAGSGWAAQQASIESAFVDVFKYFEHSWSVSGPTLQSLVDNKKTWANTIDLAVNASESAVVPKATALFTTPNEDRFAVFNPLAFDRTDAVDVIVSADGPYVVTDVESNSEVVSQYFTRGATKILRVLASVPPLGYRVYRYAPGTPAARPAAATFSAGTTLESDRYKVVVGAGGKITSLVEKSTMRELAGAGLNDFGSGSNSSVVSEEVGPVSATMKIEVGGTPARRVRITLMKDVDRVAIDDEILANHTALSHFRFDVAATNSHIRFEEVGAIARPGSAAQSGNFQPGARVDYMTLNHFATVTDGSYNLTLSSWDAFVMQVGASTIGSFDLKPQINVLATGNPGGGGINDQGGDSSFRFRFALAGGAGAFSGAASMSAAMAHQNPLYVIVLPRNQTGKYAAPAGSLLAVSPSNLLVTTFKPAEEGDRGLIVRLWELDGKATPFVLDTSAFAPTVAFQTSAIETDLAPVTLNGGRIVGALSANEIRTYRFMPGAMTGTIDRDAGFDADMLLGAVDSDGGAGADLAMTMTGDGDGAMMMGGDGGDMMPKGSSPAGCGCHTHGGVEVTGIALFACAVVVFAARARRRKR